MDYQLATRAYRQLAVELRARGLNEEADGFAYRSQLLQRHALLRQFKPVRWLGSCLLDLISGYGYMPMRSVIAYVAIISVFAGLYLLNAQFAAPHLSWDEALVL
ncbi:MAG TPA: pentapeptide repeat-containing protein, partial [Ktedonobacterales bacterium]